MARARPRIVLTVSGVAEEDQQRVNFVSNSTLVLLLGVSTGCMFNTLTL